MISPKTFLYLLLVVVIVAAAGCGKRRPPLPPVERVQQRTELLSGAQQGNEVILSWPAPQRNAPDSSVQSIRRIDVYRLAEKPGEYYNRIYGIEEVGGTSVLFLSAVPFDQIGLRTNVPKEALPETTWRVLELLPDVVSTGAVLLGGVWWITNRREEVAKAEGRH